MDESPPQGCIAIIPARGGSKRIPDKNIKPFFGKPMIAHIIERARASGVFDTVMVSTDSDSIAEVAKIHGAAVPFMRDASYATDRAGLDGVIVEVLERYKAMGRRFKYGCCLLATSPMMLPEDVSRGYDALKAADSRMAVAVTSFPYCIFRAFTHDDNGRAVMVWPENLRRHSQEFPETFHDAGMFYWFETERFLANPHEFFADAVPVFIPRDRVQDIDTPEDWAHAETLYGRLVNKAEAAHP
jgi:N-acylneuraminate cytidylyltransferase